MADKKYLDSTGLQHLWSLIKNLVNTKSTVTCTSNKTEGDKIGTITIDGTSTDLYCNVTIESDVIDCGTIS